MQGYIGLDAITGATVTVIAQNQVMLRSGVAIARQVGILQSEPKPQARFTADRRARSWDQLVREGSVQAAHRAPGTAGPAARSRALHRHVFRLPQRARGGQEPAGRDGYERLMSTLER
jgi:NosR/NirI family transcriptional regulator, nitrous oxide reductase regulator